MSFGERLRGLIEKRGITQKELAREFNIAASTLGCYVQNTREPDFKTLRALADYFDVSTDFLLEHKVNATNTLNETELIQIFRSLTLEEQRLYLEQGYILAKYSKKERKSSISTLDTGNKAI